MAIGESILNIAMKKMWQKQNVYQNKNKVQWHNGTPSDPAPSHHPPMTYDVGVLADLGIWVSACFCNLLAVGAAFTCSGQSVYHTHVSEMLCCLLRKVFGPFTTRVFNAKPPGKRSLIYFLETTFVSLAEQTTLAQKPQWMATATWYWLNHRSWLT